MCIFEKSMAVYFKFKSAKDYDSLSIDGHFISVGNLKDKIVEKKNLGRGTDFDLLISNAQTNEEYADEAQLIPRNTSVLVRRVPGRRQRPIVTEVRDEKVNEDAVREQASPVQHVDGIAHMPLSKQVDESEWGDEFGVDLYTMPENPPLQHLSSQQFTPPRQLQPQLLDADKLEEEDKIKAFVDASATDWQRQTQESLAAGKGFGRGGQGRGFGARGGYGRSLGPEKKNPPPGYVCHRCGVAGHFIQHCPTNGDPAYDVKKMKPPTGIPKSMLVANADGSYALPSGEVAILRPNEAMFEKEVEGLPSSSKSMIDIPFELRCPLCSGVLRDAVLTSRCCFKSYCDECIRHQLMSNGKCVCGATNVLADDLLPNKTLREAIIRLLGTSTATSSAERPGSLCVVPDMESAQRPKLRAPSPSGSQRSRPRAPSPSISGSQRTGSVAAAPALTGKDLEIGNAVSSQQKQPSLVVNIKHRKPEMLEQTADSLSRQEGRSQGDILGSQSNLNVEEEVQQESVTEAAKKRKLKPKRQKPINGETNGYYRNAVSFDPLADGGMMSYPGNPALYGNFWPGPPQYIVDAYGQPMLNPQYSMFGYGVPGIYGAGMMLPDPACVSAMPVFESSRDGMDHSGGGSSIMSREEFEARKAELRRKRELEQRSQNREDVTNAEIGDPGSSKGKRLSKSSNSIARSPLHDTNDAVEKDVYPTRKKLAATSLPPEAKRKRHERREELTSIDSRFERLNEDHRASESIERSDKKPKGSVFSRISFPDLKGTSKGLSTERLLEGKDMKAEGGFTKGRRVSGISSQDSMKLSNGWKTNLKDDQLRLANRSVSKSKMEEEETDVADDDEAFERNFKHRTSYSSSPGDVSTRLGKRRKL